MCQFVYYPESLICQDDIVLAISRSLLSFVCAALLSSFSICLLVCLSGLDGPIQAAAPENTYTNSQYQDIFWDKTINNPFSKSFTVAYSF